MTDYRWTEIHATCGKIKELVGKALNEKLSRDFRYMSDEDVVLLKETANVVDELVGTYDMLMEEMEEQKKAIDEIMVLTKRIEARS